MDKLTYHTLVFEVTKQIPHGRITTYGAIAEYLAFRSPRMVGWALNHCSFFESGIPAHRVVNRKGELTGRHHFPTPTMMEELLRQEGVAVSNDTVVDFDKRFIHPNEFMGGR
ncbi:MAG: MGMT family protein [Saprospiraceae bacterium]|nr:MGMT family protein [Saprospiraceae bacterium]